MPILFHRHFSLGTVLYFGIILSVLLALVGYGLFHARHVFEGPFITLENEGAVQQYTPTLPITGRAENIISLSLNDRTIYTDDSGHFSETLILPPGYTIMTLTAEDRYGRVHSVERTYVRS